MNEEDYREHIDRLIREMSGETVLNGSAAHASIIIERMFANAAERVAILSRRFDPRIYGTSEAIEQAELLLGDPNRSIDVLLESAEPDYLQSHPFFGRLGHFLERGNLRLRQVPPRVVEFLNVNFAIMDKNGYRFERDKTQPVAVASFGDTSFTSSLTSFYEELWAIGDDVKLRITA